MDTETTQETTISRALGPEDITRGDYIAALTVTVEYLDVYRDCRNAAPEVCRATFIPDTFKPYKVLGVCLPFVLVEDAKGESSTLDTRLTALARLDEDFAKRAMKKARRDSALTP
jgi:hypothetical protein